MNRSARPASDRGGICPPDHPGRNSVAGCGRERPYGGRRRRRLPITLRNLDWIAVVDRSQSAIQSAIDRFGKEPHGSIAE